MLPQRTACLVTARRYGGAARVVAVVRSGGVPKARKQRWEGRRGERKSGGRFCGEVLFACSRVDICPRPLRAGQGDCAASRITRDCVRQKCVMVVHLHTASTSQAPAHLRSIGSLHRSPHALALTVCGVLATQGPRPRPPEKREKREKTQKPQKQVLSFVVRPCYLWAGATQPQREHVRMHTRGPHK